MKIAIARETKRHEYRVAATPSCVEAYVTAGHAVAIETGAGDGAGYTDGEYERVGARIEPDRAALFGDAEMILKVKEPLPDEIALLRKGQILFTYLHLASSRELTDGLLERGVTGVAYETIQMEDGSLPCLTPMSEIAGRLAVHEGAKYLEKAFGGRGILLGGVPGVRKGKVVIIGGGVVGLNAGKIAVGVGADVTILDISQRRLAYLDDIFGPSIQTLYSHRTNILTSIANADVVIGAVLVPGASAPRLVLEDDIRSMPKGSVLVDVAIDQGGCTATSRPTSHDDPIFIKHDVVHYCVTNMPGAVALTATLALTSATRLYGLMLANLGIEKAITQEPALRKGVNVLDGKLTCKAVADSLGMPCTELG